MKIAPPSTKLFVVWCTDAATEFSNGCLDGILVGSGGGIITIAQTDTTAPAKLVLNGAIGFLCGMGLSGLSAFKVWHKTNRIPNPFRSYFTGSIRAGNLRRDPAGWSFDWLVYERDGWGTHGTIRLGKVPTQFQ